MNFESTFAAVGFSGGIAIGQLQASCAAAPEMPGVYAVLRKSSAPVQLLQSSSGGRFKNRNPSTAIAKLQARWLPDAEVLYIGKAGGSRQRSTLRSRIHSYMQFGLGQPCAHWGGRYIWQLAGAKELVVSWAAIPNEEPAQVESRLLHEFVQSYNRLPFANLRR